MLRSFHTSIRALTITSLFIIPLAVGCGSDSGDSSDDGSSTGATGTGAQSSTGGSATTGGVSGTGGTSSAGGSGGSVGTGGTGGEATTGGVSGTGGEAATGGTAATGGDAGTGGEAATGGTSSGGTGGSSTGGTGGGSPTDEKFSFFVTSQVALKDLSGSPDGFGGDLRYGETGAGAGLRGADKICAAVAERSMPGNGKTWRAFLSAKDGGNGTQVNAIDRIGEGPWYDRLGRLVANDTSELQNARPSNADAEIKNDLPNENGVGNHAPDGTQVDNHDTLTGSNSDGELESMGRTCNDWTSAAGAANTAPQIGHSWPRGANNGTQWIADHRAGGCAPGGVLAGAGPAQGDYRVGAGGGYGGFYCFALTP